jgi:c(7)-type cytochrome triheme protein
MSRVIIPPLKTGSTETDCLALRRIRRRRLAVLAFAGAAAFACSSEVGSSVSATLVEPNPGLRAAGPAQEKGTDYSRFTHTGKAHSRLPCSACHIREVHSPQANWLGHRPCSSCHAPKFAARSGPICTVCHNTEQPKGGDLKSLRGLKGFNARFDHTRHSQVNCAECHKPASRGVALSIPSGAAAHANCFQCHSPQTQSAGAGLSSCGSCHQPGRRRRPSLAARSYRLNFSHSDHSRERLRCNDCHRVRAGSGWPSRMSHPVPAMHFASASVQSCKSCHNEKRAFGDDQFSNCKKCHEGQSFRF